MNPLDDEEKIGTPWIVAILVLLALLALGLVLYFRMSVDMGKHPPRSGSSAHAETFRPAPQNALPQLSAKLGNWV